MREIGFRGKRIDTSEWVYGDLIHERWGTCIQYIVRKHPKGAGAPEREPTTERYKVTVDPETVGEYTGLPDKNGKEIYEGDILQADDPKDRLTFSVKWYENGGFNLLGINTPAFKVIGNIHDKKENESCKTEAE